MSKCDVCNANIPLLGGIKVKDGTICGSCTNLSSNFRMESIIDLKKYYQLNNDRKKIFQETQKLKSILSDVISIDDNNKLFYIVPKKKGFDYIIYSFDEIINYLTK